MKKIAAVGAVYLDINVPGFPIPSPIEKLLNNETVGSGYEVVLGGSAVNFSRFCKKLGLQSLFIGKTGSDTIYALLTKEFAKEGIVPALSQRENVQTNINTNIINGSSESIMLSFGNANQSLAAGDVLTQLEAHEKEIDMLCIGGAFKLKTLLPDLLAIIKTVHEKGKKVILDHGRIVNTVTEGEKKIMREVVKAVDVYLPSKEEFLDLWSVYSLEKGLHLFEENKPQIVVKDAQNGAYTLQNGNLLPVGAFHVVPYNIVGAGDVFNAGFIAAQANGLSLADSIRFANGVAALKISQNHFPTEEEIKALLLQ